MKTLRSTTWLATGLLGLCTLVAMPVSADFVIVDDLIVDGSACIGFDCVNGESFGFDTLRIKENNLRIKFDDTSTTTGFPNHDWQITFNDSANGGAEQVLDRRHPRPPATPFTIEANAPSQLALRRRRRAGRLRHQHPGGRAAHHDGDTPTLRLEQDGSSGFTPQTWDVAGNETNFFVRDVTNGSTLPFRIRPGRADQLDLHRRPTGDVGFGTVSPAQDPARPPDHGGTTFAQLENTAAASTAAWFLAQQRRRPGTSSPTAPAPSSVSLDGTGVNELEVDAAGNLFIRGNCSQAATREAAPAPTTCSSPTTS